MIHHYEASFMRHEKEEHFLIDAECLSIALLEATQRCPKDARLTSIVCTDYEASTN